MDNYEYEMPSDFEDEDIDDEMAFTGRWSSRPLPRRCCSPGALRRQCSLHPCPRQAGRAFDASTAAGPAGASSLFNFACVSCMLPAEEDKKLFGHMFDDLAPGGGSGGEEDDGGASDLLSSGESGDEGEEEEDGWSDEEGEGGGPGGRRQGDPDELDELFGQVGGGCRSQSQLALVYPAPWTGQGRGVCMLHPAASSCNSWCAQLTGQRASRQVPCIRRAKAQRRPAAGAHDAYPLAGSGTSRPS